MYCLMRKHTPGMFLTDFHTRKYTGGIISRVGIFLTVAPVAVTPTLQYESPVKSYFTTVCMTISSI